MIRRVSFISRKAGLSRSEFFAHWFGRHAELVRQLPGLRGLRFTRVDRSAPESAGWDGLGETWFDSIPDSDHAFAIEPFRTLLLEDREKFIGALQSCYVEDPSGFAPADAGIS